MYCCLMTVKSQTQAMKMSRVLARAGIGHAVVKPPGRLLINSCTHGVQIGQKDLGEALTLLRQADMSPLTVYTAFPGGGYEPMDAKGAGL